MNSVFVDVERQLAYFAKGSASGLEELVTDAGDRHSSFLYYAEDQNGEKKVSSREKVIAWALSHTGVTIKPLKVVKQSSNIFPQQAVS